MTIKLSFEGPNNLSDLHDLILSNMPTLQPIVDGFNEEGTIIRRSIMEVIGQGNLVYLTVPDDTDTETLGLIVNDYMSR